MPWQVLPTPNVTPFVQQQNYGQMKGNVLLWNPNCGGIVDTFINSALRKVLDRRTWFSQFVKGQLVCPAATTQGQATVTLGSNIVQGIGTSWTSALICQQFRIGYNNPIYTIFDVDPIGQQLALELAWGAQSTTSGYFILQYYYNLGPNIKYLKNMVNMQLGFRMWTHGTQDWLNAVDPWRQNQNWPFIVAPMPLDSSGNYLVELYPASWIQQAFPFLAYVQPPNLVNDLDTLPAYIRCDVVLLDAIAQALVWRGPKNNPYYDANEAAIKRAQFESELNQMAQADENLYRTNLSLPFEDVPYYSPAGAMWNAMHAVSAGGGAAYGDF